MINDNPKIENVSIKGTTFIQREETNLQDKTVYTMDTSQEEEKDLLTEVCNYYVSEISLGDDDFASNIPCKGFDWF